MAKKSGIDLSLGEGTLNRLRRASEAEMGVGEFQSKGFDQALDAVSAYAQDRLTTARTEKEEEEAKLEQDKKLSEDKINKAAEEALAVGGSLTPNYFDNYYDDVQDLKQRYLAATNDKERALVMQEMNKLKLETNTFKDQRKSMADSQTKNLLSEAMTKEQKDIMSAWLKGDTNIVKKDGKRYHQIEVNGEIKEFTDDEISEMQVLKATEFNKSIGDLAVNVQKKAGTEEYYDRAGTQRQIMNSIRKEDLPSLINDKSDVTGQSFKQAAIQGLSNATYNDIAQMLGPDALQKEEGEEFWYSNISEKDRELLADALTNPNNPNYSADVTSAAVGNYFFNFVDQQYKDTLEGARQQQIQKNIQAGKASANKQISEIEEEKRLGYNPSGDVDSYMKIFES